jgi:hypothetical protein
MATLTNEAIDQYTTVVETQPLLTGDVYTFRVIANNVVGDSAPSATFSAMAAVRSDAPGAP